MQPIEVLHILILILLTTALIEAYYTNTPRCTDMCGNVWIPYPFGIGRNCSANEWFTIACNSSTPYLSALNSVEVLIIAFGTVTVNMPVIKADCKNPVKNTNLVPSTGHGKNPFLFSRSGNRLVFKGCGSAAIMENGTIVQRLVTILTLLASDSNNCFGNGCCQPTIPHDLASFTINLTGLESQDEDGSCGSAFLTAEDYVGSLSSQSSAFSPISLSLNETFDLDLTRCNETCGEVSIPHPCGIERSCSESDWYNVNCNSSTPYLPGFNNVEVLGFNLEDKTITVNVSMISDCENPLQNNSLDLISESPFRISGTNNMFVVEGCGGAVIIENGTVVCGCSTTCGSDTVSDINSCYGFRCCRTAIPHDLRSFTFNLTGLQRQAGNGTCGSAFLVDRNSFNEGRFSRQFVPVTLGWGEIPFSLSPECRWCELHGGVSNSTDTDDGISGITCLYYESSKASHNGLGVILGVSISMGSLLLTIISYALYKINKKIKGRRKNERYFKRNGGLLLTQQEATDRGLVDKTILFTSNELAKATDSFNENRILCRGGQGTVYKGMLTDGRIVAIKKSKVVDESQLEQFINEVVILSQVNHRNVVKLLGCCLETEVPILVSELISNGTLYDFIQDETSEFSISLNMRLQIATEVAGALSYLHSSTSIPIYHRDIKTTNIL